MKRDWILRILQDSDANFNRDNLAGVFAGLLDVPCPPDGGVGGFVRRILCSCYLLFLVTVFICSIYEGFQSFHKGTKYLIQPSRYLDQLDTAQFLIVTQTASPLDGFTALLFPAFSKHASTYKIYQDHLPEHLQYQLSLPQRKRPDNCSVRHGGKQKDAPVCETNPKHRCCYVHMFWSLVAEEQFLRGFCTYWLRG